MSPSTHKHTVTAPDALRIPRSCAVPDTVSVAQPIFPAATAAQELDASVYSNSSIGTKTTPRSNNSRRYTHNPYASQHANEFPIPSNASGKVDSSCSKISESTMEDSSTCTIPTDGGAEECAKNRLLYMQFFGVVGNIAWTACTVAGRHIVVSALRMQHAEVTQIIIKELLPQFHALALDQQGSHVVRALVETVSTEQMEALVPFFAPETVLALAVNSPSTRCILQSIFNHHRSEALMPIVATIAQDSRRLAMSQQGSIVVICAIEKLPPRQRHCVIESLLPSLLSLTMSCYGNYVVQCILQHVDRVFVVSLVYPALSGHWLALSCNKFASNVVEKVVWQLDGASRRVLVSELVLNVTNLSSLMQDKFGNFVLQAIFGSSNDPDEFREILNCVHPLLHVCPYRQRIEGGLQSSLVRVLQAGGRRIE